jgi:YD repeat-containing protein
MLKKYYFLSCILIACLLYSCKKDDGGSGSETFRLRMVLSETTKTVYTYSKNKLDSVYIYTNDFGIWNLQNIKTYEYNGTNDVTVKQVNYIGNMVTGGSNVVFEFQNNKIINRSGIGGINQSFKYDGDMLIEVCDTPSLIKIEYNNKLVSKMLSHSYTSKTKEFSVSNEFDFNYSIDKVEIVTYSFNTTGVKKIQERRIKFLQNDAVIKEEYYFPISNIDSTRYTSIFNYDDRENLIKRTISNEEDPNSSTYEYRYDQYENLIETISTSGNGDISHTYYYYESGSSNSKQFDFPKIKFVDFYVRELNFNSY